MPAVRDAVKLDLDEARAAAAEPRTPDENRVRRVVRPAHRLGRTARGDEDGRVKPERVAVDVVEVVAPGAHLVARSQRGIEERRRAGADPAGQCALRLRVAVDDRATLLEASGPRDGSDHLPEVERLARADDGAVDDAGG